MSVDFYVATNRRDLPSAAAWASTLRELGFGVALDTTLDPAHAEGYWPCPDARQGFEYAVGPMGREDLTQLGLSPPQARQVATFDTLVTLSLRREADMAAAQGAAAVLARLSKGLLLEGESGALMTADQAVAWAQGRYNPPTSASARLVLARPRTSTMTWVRLGVLALILCFWLVRWMTGR